jgi:hypothetical protein
MEKGEGEPVERYLEAVRNLAFVFAGELRSAEEAGYGVTRVCDEVA